MLEAYIRAFRRLKRDINRQRWSPLTKDGAPYKPLLLLTVIDQISQSV
ncbi:MAG: hypothetical protein JSS81_26405 [Acidobacteria bacterium]|nr:hypothetical protein [Acidobacteriota bacterium]